MRLFFLAFLMMVISISAQANPQRWKWEWPDTDFSKSIVDFKEIISGGPPKDGIPAIDNPKFKAASEVTHLGEQEPVITVEHDGEAKAYPVQVLIWHEIANDKIGDIPITITFCPLCNSSVVFDRRLGDQVLDFGVSGKLRHSDMIMYDRQTESWWQQFTGVGIVGQMTGETLTMVPSRTEPFKQFKKDHPEGLVLVPGNNRMRRYGSNPYAGYDSAKFPFLYKGDYDGPVPAMAYVIAIGNEAWPLAYIREKGIIKENDLIIEWSRNMNSALDKSSINEGRDIGYVHVSKNGEPVVHDVTFAFAFKAFYPDGIIHTE